MTSEEIMTYFRSNHIRIGCHNAEDLQVLKAYLLAIDPNINTACLIAGDLGEFPYAGPAGYDQWVLWRGPDTVTWSIERALSELSAMTEPDEEIPRPNLEDVLWPTKNFGITVQRTELRSTVPHWMIDGNSVNLCCP